ncbi:class I SAM-dependent methyltransferase [Antrihabitans stalactiti]|nr:class I SAM-dependent methyltransferase [Antrihabitans stalactiti]
MSPSAAPDSLPVGGNAAWSRSMPLQLVYTEVAPIYDKVNFMMTGGQDAGWRRQAVGMLELGTSAKVLDIATGTGAVATALAAERPGVSFLGIDINNRMLEYARQRMKRLTFLRPESSWRVAHCAAERLHDIANQSLDAATIAFAMDDLDDTSAALNEVHRVLRSGGRFVVLEFAVRGGNRTIERCAAAGLTVRRTRSLAAGLVRIHLCVKA